MPQIHPDLLQALSEVTDPMNQQIQGAMDTVVSAARTGLDAIGIDQAKRDWLSDQVNMAAQSGVDLGFTVPEGVANMAMGLASSGRRASPEAAQGLKKMVTEAHGLFIPKATDLVEGPYPLHKWSYNPPLSSAENPAANISFKVNEVADDLESAFGRQATNKARLNDMMRYGEDAPYKNSLGSLVHEIKHNANILTPDDMWRLSMDLDKKQLLRDYGTLDDLPFDLRQAAKKDYAQLRDIHQSGDYLPRFLRDPNRWQYGLTGWDSARRIGDESAADLAAAVSALGTDWMDQIFTNIFPNKDPLKAWMQMGGPKR